MGITTEQIKLLKFTGPDARSICELGAQTVLHKELGIEPTAACELYAQHGFTEYESIDINGGTFEFDLNRPLPWLDPFDVVTNYGTTACIFNQGAVFETIHNLCQSGGYMIHTLPLEHWGDELFYFYDRRFIEHLADTNHYAIITEQEFTRAGTRRVGCVLQRPMNDDTFRFPIHSTYAA